MSLLPYIFDELYVRPSRLQDQHFGMALSPEDMLEAFVLPGEANRLLYNPIGYLRPWRTQASQQDAGSTVTMDKDKFQVNMDVQHFKPEEITVKVTGDNEISIEGKHEEKRDEHGFISRQFTRKYVLPKGHDVQRIESKLSSDGVLTITAPKVDDKAIEGHRSIPIQQTGQPLKKPVEQKKEENMDTK